MFRLHREQPLTSPVVTSTDFKVCIRVNDHLHPAAEPTGFEGLTRLRRILIFLTL